METHDYTVREVITAVRWVEMTNVTSGCIWKRIVLWSSDSETNDSSAGYSFHDAVQSAANSSHQSPPQFYEGTVLNVWMVLRHKRLCYEKLKSF